MIMPVGLGGPSAASSASTLNLMQGGGRFSNTCHIRPHEKTNTGEKPYGFSMCPRCSSTRATFPDERTHTGEKPYPCSCAACAHFAAARIMLSRTSEPNLRCEHQTLKYRLIQPLFNAILKMRGS